MVESALQLQSKGKEICKETNILDKSEEMSRKRKRMIKEQLTGASEHEHTVRTPITRNRSSTVNLTNSSVRDPSRKSGPRGKETGDDRCHVCDLGGDLLCCESCRLMYHLECLSPPRKRKPRGAWLCPCCREISGVTKGIDDPQDSKPRIKSTSQVGLTPGSAPTGGVCPLGTSAPGSAPTFCEFGQKLGGALGNLVSQKLEASFGPLLAEAKAGATLKRQVTKLTAKLQESECLRTDLNNQVAALKAELLQCAEKSVLEAACICKSGLDLQKELDWVKEEAQMTTAGLKTELKIATEDVLELQKELDRVKEEAQMTIAGLKTELKIATEDVHSRTKDQENLKVIMKTLTGQLDALKEASATNEAKLREENSVLQQQLQSQRSSIDRYKEEFQVEMKKVADLDEEVQSLKDQIENHKFTAERAEKAQAALRNELNQVKTQSRILQIFEE